ncbi:TPA: hypothetical protein ACYLN4_000656 [Burkholderia lata]
MTTRTIVVDYAMSEPLVAGAFSDTATALRTAIGQITVRNAGLAGNHPEIRDSLEEYRHCGGKVVVES